MLHRLCTGFAQYVIKTSHQNAGFHQTWTILTQSWKLSQRTPALSQKILSRCQSTISVENNTNDTIKDVRKESKDSTDTIKASESIKNCGNETIPSVDVNYEKLLSKIQAQCPLDVQSKKLFAVVHAGGKQWKVATNDVIMLNKPIEAKCGDTIRLEKVLAVGGSLYTLLGQPLLKRDLVNVQAMVMEKTKGEKLIVFKYKRRKRYKKEKGHRQHISVLKIKSITIDSSAL